MALYYDPAGYPPPRLIFDSLTDAGYRTVYSTTKNQQEGFDCGRRSAFALEALAAAAPASRAAYFTDILAA